MPFSNRPFRIRLAIDRSTFADYESFVRTFAHSANLTIEGFDESSFTYIFGNQWKCSLNHNGNIVLISPLLSGERAKEAYSLVEALKQINVKVGENCHAEIDNQRFPDLGIWMRSMQRIRGEILCGLFLVLFIVTKTIELQLQEIVVWYWILLLQILGYGCFLLFTISLCKGISRKRGVELGFPDLVGPKAETNAQRPADELGPSMLEKEALATTLPPAMNVFELAQEIKLPLDNIMAYIRFYQSATDKQSQHWKDLAEIMEQAIQIQEILNRVESHSSQKPGMFELVSEDPSHLFRRTPRTMELIPLTVKGIDALGRAFEAPSYTLNLSARGACVLFPNKMTRIGQKIQIENHHFETEASVRWVIEGKSGNMVFAGVQFARPILSLEPTAPAEVFSGSLSRVVNFSS